MELEVYQAQYLFCLFFQMVLTAVRSWGWYMTMPKTMARKTLLGATTQAVAAINRRQAQRWTTIICRRITACSVTKTQMDAR